MRLDKSEKSWRMPLHKNYDKLINSKNADANINYVGGAGSTTAACFTKIYLNKTPWVHLYMEWLFQNMEGH